MGVRGLGVIAGEPFVLQVERKLWSQHEGCARQVDAVTVQLLDDVAQGLGCRHVAIPERDCYLRIGRAERACRFRGPGIVLCAASMAAECLIYRLHRRNPAGTYVDCGHIFDAMVWRPTRRYTKRNVDGILELLKEHYCPMFPKE